MKKFSKLMVLCIGLTTFNISYADGGLLFLDKVKATNTVVKEKMPVKDKAVKSDAKGKSEKR